MGEYGIGFEATDYAGLVWIAVGVLAAVRAGLYVAQGRWPASMWTRGVVVGGAVALLGAAMLRGWLRPGQWSHGVWCLALALLVLPLVLRTYGQTTRPIGRGVRWTLIGLRLAAGFTILIMLARPVLEHRLERRERATVGILVDTSQSMDVRDVVAGDAAKSATISRRDVVRQALAACEASLDRLSRQMNVEWMAFDANLRKTEGPELTSAGRITALHRNVEAAGQTLIQTGAKVAGLLVISDGRDTAGGDAVRSSDELASAGIPLLCVGVGDELPAGQTRSLQARRLDMVDHVSVLNRLEIEAEFLAAGLAGTPINVRLEYDGKPVGETQMVPSQVRELVRTSLAHVPTEAGLHRVTVTANVPGLNGRQGEASLTKYVRVTEDRVQVLYLDRARYERAAIARALEYAKEFSVTKVDLSIPIGGGEGILPQELEKWRMYRVIVLGDVDRANLPGPAMQAMTDLVMQQGRGMALLGGLRTLGSGRYLGTPLEKLFAADLASAGQIEGPVKFELTSAGRTHPCCMLSETNDVAWKKLPPFAGASRIHAPGPTGEVLIRSMQGEPLLTVQQRSAGRTAVVAFDSTWQWPFAMEAGLDMQRRFWRQLVLWLANRQPEVWVLADRPQYDLLRLSGGDEHIIVRAGVSDPSVDSSGGAERASAGGAASRPALSHTVTGEWSGSDGQWRPLSFKPTADGFEAVPVVSQAGEYHVRVQGTAGGQPAGRAETAFVVEQVDREMLDPLADLETLKRMAVRTASIGGMYVPITDLAALLERVRAGGAETRITLVERENLVDDRPWIWLVVFAFLLTLEWIVRRWAGLV